MTTSLPAFGLTLLYTAGFLLTLLLSVRTWKLEHKSPWIHVGIVVVLSLGLWMIFYPASMSPDSVEQYTQAHTQEFRDWHPPIMALVLSGVMICGGDIEALMLLQCLLGSLGIYYCAKQIIGISKIPPRAASCLALMLFCMLLYPISPLAAYLMIFWKDTWCAILMLWMLSISLKLYYNAHVFSKLKFYGSYFAFILLAAITLLTRHNAIVMLPFLVLISSLILFYQRRFSWSSAFVFSLSLLMMYIGLYKGQYFFFQVEQQHAGQQVIALDLVGMIVHKPELQHEFPYISQHVTDKYAEVYEYGDIVPLYTSVLKTSSFDRDEMLREYRHAILKHPLTWLYVKLRAFYELIRPSRIHYWFLMGISENPYGLSQNTLLQSLRESLRIRLLIVWNSPILRVFSGIHLVWIGVTIWTIGSLGKRFYTCRQPAMLLWLSVFSMLFAYYASYLFATTAWDFRLMYPATLSGQVIILAYLLKVLYEKYNL